MTSAKTDREWRDAAIKLRVCLGCKWQHGFQTGRRCFSPHQGSDLDPVEGLIGRTSTCESQRTRLWRWLGHDVCGPEGKYFEQYVQCADKPARPLR